MSSPTLRQRLQDGGKVFAAWIASGNARIAETLARAGFDAVLVDLQHGEASFAEARDCLAATALAGRPAGVRVGLEGYADAARLMDLGAQIAIMPMVNSAEDARKLVEALKYPPEGGRSWGPPRAITLQGSTVEDYRTGSNRDLVVLAMIETRAAVENIEAIANTPGIDGLFVGPYDLATALSGGKAQDTQAPQVEQAIDKICATAKSAGKIPGIYCRDAEGAVAMAKRGFRFIVAGNDHTTLRAATVAQLKTLKS